MPVGECPGCHEKDCLELNGGILTCKFCGTRYLPDIYDKALRSDYAKGQEAEQSKQASDEDKEAIAALKSKVWDMTCGYWTLIGAAGAGYLIRKSFVVESVWLSSLILVWLFWSCFLANQRPDGYCGIFFPKQNRLFSAILLALCGALAALAVGWLVLLIMGVPL